MSDSDGAVGGTSNDTETVNKETEQTEEKTANQGAKEQTSRTEELEEGDTAERDTDSETDSTDERQATKTMEKTDFMKLMAATIRANYSGDPLGLQPFLASIDLIRDMAEDDAGLLTLLRKFVLSKLEGYASEIIPANTQTIDEVINALKAKITPESVKVIEGRMMALRADKTNMQDYAKRAEDLADALRRALVMDGISIPKAEEMTIDKTVELCRSNAQNNVVKSVLASTKFTNPKEVIAKFVVEANTTRQEAQVLAMRKYQQRGNSNNSYRGNNNNGNNRTNNWRGNSNRTNNWRGNSNRNNNWRGNNNNRNSNWRNNNNSNNNGNFRNNNGGSNRRGGWNNNRNNSQNVRRTENASAAQSILGKANDE